MKEYSFRNANGKRSIFSCEHWYIVKVVYKKNTKKILIMILLLHDD